MSKQKIFIDCDPGHDDAIALLLACYSDELDLIGVSTCSGNQTVEKTALNASNLLHFFNREDIPLAIGNKTPIIRPSRICPEIHGESGLDGFDFPKYEHHYSELSGVDLIIKKLLENEDVIMVTTGPMTNLGLAINKNREILKHIKTIVLMGGSTEEGNITKEAEFNILVDPEAADICFKSGVPIRMLGLNVTRSVLATEDVVNEAAKINTRGSDLFVKLMKVFNQNQKDFFGLEAGPLHDPATIVSILDENVFVFEPMNVQIDTSNSEKTGKTLCLKEGKFNAEVAVQVDVKKYWNVVYNYLRKCI